MSLTTDLVQLLELPTWVPAGAVEPDAAHVATLVDDGVVPLLQRRAPSEIRRHDHGDVAARYGPEGDDGILLMAYIVAQHGDPADDVPAVLGEGSATRVRGRGAAQCKGALASALAAIDDLPGDLRRPVWVAINTEGSSSHGGSRRLLDDLEVRAGAGVVLTGTDLKISRANRGRVDVVIRIGGVACHSSQPALGANPFDRLPEVLARVRSIRLPPDHAELGSATVVPFAIRAEPVAPHTIPGELVVTLDRRLLPGESPTAAVDSVREALDSIEDVSVMAGRTMLPASVAADAPIVTALSAGLRAADRPTDVVTSSHTFDAGYPCSLGIPTPMFGPGRRRFGPDMVEPESVSVRDCDAAASTLSTAIERLCC